MLELRVLVTPSAALEPFHHRLASELAWINYSETFLHKDDKRVS